MIKKPLNYKEPVKNKGKDVKLKKDIKKLRCSKCGNEIGIDDARSFYLSKNSEMFVANDGRPPFCFSCINDLMKRLIEQYGYFVAIEVICYHLDLPYIHNIAQIQLAKGNINSFGSYSKTLGTKKFAGKTYLDTVLEHSKHLHKNIVQSPIHDTIGWTQSDKKKADSIISRCGYDPFFTTTDSEARKFMFNTMYEYMVDDTVVDNIHKRQAVINIVLTFYQISEIDKRINFYYSDKTSQQDNVLIDDLVSMKQKLLSSVDKIAKENGISVSSNKHKTSHNALSYKLKELREIGMDSEEVNLFDINTSKAMEQVANLSVKNVISQLQLSESETLEMVALQTERIYELEKTVSKLEEENRLLQLKQAKTPKDKIDVEIFIDDNNDDYYTNDKLEDDGGLIDSEN